MSKGDKWSNSLFTGLSFLHPFLPLWWWFAMWLSILDRWVFLAIFLTTFLNNQNKIKVKCRAFFYMINVQKLTHTCWKPRTEQLINVIHLIFNKKSLSRRRKYYWRGPRQSGLSIQRWLLPWSVCSDRRGCSRTMFFEMFTPVVGAQGEALVPLPELALGRST